MKQWADQCVVEEEELLGVVNIGLNIPMPFAIPSALGEVRGRVTVIHTRLPSSSTVGDSHVIVHSHTWSMIEIRHIGLL